MPPKTVPMQYSVETVPALIANERRTVSIRTRSDAYFVACAIVGSYTQDCLVRISDDSMANAAWCSDPNGVRAANILGTAQRPLWLRPAVVMNPNTQIDIILTNLFAGANTVQLTFFGYKWMDLANEPLPEQRRGGGARVRWFQYIVNQALGALNANTAQTRIQADSTFVASELMSVQTGAWRGRLHDTGSGRDWEDARIRNANLAGTALFPAFLNPSYPVAPGSTLQCEIEDLSAAPNVIQLAVTGHKVFLGA